MKRFIETLEKYLSKREFYVYCEIDYSIICKDNNVEIIESSIYIRDYNLLIYGVGNIKNPKKLIELELIPIVDNNITSTCADGTIIQKTLKGDLVFKATKESIINQGEVFTNSIDIHKEEKNAHDSDSGEIVDVDFNLMKFKIKVNFTDKFKKEISSYL